MVQTHGGPWPDRAGAGGTGPLARLRRRAGGRLSGFALRLGILIAAVLLLVGGATQIAPAIAAAQGQGRHGYFVAETERCDRSGCAWNGDFLLPDGRVVLQQVDYRGSVPTMRTGTVVPALDSGDRSAVYPDRGSRRWILVMVLMIAAAVTLPWWAWSVPGRAIRRHRRRRLPAAG